MRADVELDIGRKTFASGLLPELIAVLRRSRPGDLVAVVGDEESIGPELETWCRFTGNPLLEATAEKGRLRWVFRCGAVPVPAGVPADDNRPVGSRLWLYTNFDCNLHCDYCCVRSSPTAPRRELGLARVQRIAREAAELGVKEIFVTGGEPFLLEDIGDILLSCAAAAPTTVLTNGMLFAGRRIENLRALPRDRIVLQISLDSATPELHDLHRGPGTWARTREGIQRARAHGFRVRLAATVSTDAEAEAFRQFLDEEKIAADRPSHPPDCVAWLCQRRCRSESSRFSAGSHHYSRWCVLASGRRGGCRSAGHARHFSSLRVLRCRPPRLRPRRRTRAISWPESLTAREGCPSLRYPPPSPSTGERLAGRGFRKLGVAKSCFQRT